MGIRTKAVVFYEEGIRSGREIGETYNISERTVKRWAKSYRLDEEDGLRPKTPRPKRTPEQHHSRWNNELSGSKRNIPHGEPAVSSTSLIFRVHGEPFIEFSSDMDFSSIL
jgi:uncharacterized protein YjcR